MALGHQERASEDWYAAVQTGSQESKWVDYASHQLMIVARQGHWVFVRDLIARSQMKEQFFPLARALDYLASGEEALIEKLTPELSAVVKQVVADLRPAGESAKSTRPAGRRRGRK